MSGSASLGTTISKPESTVSYIFLPKEALFSDSQGNDYVWKVDPANNEVHRQKVEIFKRTPQGAFISENVQPGDWIVTAGVTYLTEGQREASLSKPMKKLVEFGLQYKALMYFLTALIVIGGVYSFFAIGRLEDPAFSVKSALIVTSYPRSHSIRS